MSLPSLQVCRLEPWLPALTALHLCGNDMSALEGPALPVGAFSRLQVGAPLPLHDQAESEIQDLS